MSYNSNNKTEKSENENSKRINLDEIIEDEFDMSKKKKPINDSKIKDSEWKITSKINLNEEI